MLAGLILIGGLLSITQVPVWAASPALPSNLVHVLLQHLEARQTKFSILVPANEMNDLKSDLDEALYSDMYLEMDTSRYGYTATSFMIGDLVTFTVSYRESISQYQEVLSGVRFVLNKYILKPGMDVYAKEKAIHDFVVLNVAYDQTLTHGTAYDALYDHTATCQGYAMLTYQLLRAAGIENVLVSGTATNSLGTGAHAWNEVDLAGKWYQLDTTWDDPIPFVKGRVLYNYFNLTSAQLARTHTWNHTDLPVANTDYVTVLKESSNPADRVILQQTGLFVEEPHDTFTSLAKLQADLSLAKMQAGQQYAFRFPYADVSELGQLSLPYAAHFIYTQDARDPVYAVVTLTTVS